MYDPSQKDINCLYQNNKKLYVKLLLLNHNYQTIEELAGEIQSGSITIDADSDIRRIANFTFYIKDKSYFVNQYSKIWMDKFVDVYLGVKYIKTNEILWYPIGLFLFNDNEISYDSTTRSLSCSCVDLMGKLTGLLGGTLRGLETKIPAGSTVVNVVRDTISQLGYIKNYIINEHKNASYKLLPYDLEFSTGVSVYEILRKIADVFVDIEFFFDTDRVFRWQQIPTATSDPIVLDNDVISSLIISEDTNINFDQVFNCIEVWGKDNLSSRLILVDKIPLNPNPEYNYKVDPDSPFTIDKIGEKWKILSGGEYDAIYSGELALDRCKYELYLGTSSNDTLSLNMILIPFLNVNQKISYRLKSTGETNQYIIKNISFDLTSYQMSLECVRFSPMYSWL